MPFEPHTFATSKGTRTTVHCSGLPSRTKVALKLFVTAFVFDTFFVTNIHPNAKSYILDTKEKASRIATRLSLTRCDGLDRLNGLCLESLGSLHDVELDALTFLKAAESIRLDRGEMH